MKKFLLSLTLFSTLVFGIASLTAGYPYGYECRQQCTRQYQFCQQQGWPNCYAAYDACILGCDL